jgi:hypothetical protein
VAAGPEKRAMAGTRRARSRWRIVPAPAGESGWGSSRRAWPPRGWAARRNGGGRRLADERRGKGSSRVMAADSFSAASLSSSWICYNYLHLF